jgi:uncharacterized protein (DUF2235 family)
MPRNLVLCFDGTNNQFGEQNTNVVRLAQVIARDPPSQLLYYDPGIGTLPEPGLLTSAAKTLSRWIDLAFGTGLISKVERAYSYLMDFWEPGDRVFLFGFSRGAYAARVLAGALHGLGLLPRGNQNLVPYVFRLFDSVRKGWCRRPNKAYWRLCNQFRWSFARKTFDSDDQRRFPTYFLGLWDTVSSVGWVWDPATFPYTTSNSSVEIVRHAVSIDERRAFFRQNLWGASTNQNSEELWFPGVHADVGGGYPLEDGALWRPPFEWMIEEARQAGLVVDETRFKRITASTSASDRPWEDRQHESLTMAWWPVEFFPKLVWRKKAGHRWPSLGLGRHRSILHGARLHRSALNRIRETSYSPANLSPTFLQSVRAMSTILKEETYRPV